MTVCFQRSIVHLDADAFFASVEQAADIRLRGKPIAVGGEKRGIIASASYQARQFGIYTPMPTAMARRLCPKLIILPGDFEKYELFSRLMFSYAYDFTPDVEIGSIDEGYFDLTGARKSALNIADTIRQAIRQALKLSVSEGIGTNKLISQIASKLKKPAAFEFVPAGKEAEFLSPLANKWLPGIGPKTANQLNAAGLARIGQIAGTPPELLSLLVGNLAPQLSKFALGVDERPVIPARAPAKSYGEQETFGADTTNEEFLDATLRRMADNLMAKVRDEGKSIRTVTVKVRYNDMDEEQTGESLPEPTDLETDIYSKVSQLLRKAWKRRVSLRLVSLKLSNVYDFPFNSALPLDISSRQHDAQQRLAGIVDGLRQKFGRSALLRGHDFVLREEHGAGVPCSGVKSTQDVSSSSFKPQRREERREENGCSSLGSSRVCGSPSTSNKSDNCPASKSENRKSQIAPSVFNTAMIHRQRLGHYAASQSPSIHARAETTDTGNISKAKIGNRKSKIPSVPLNFHSYYSFLDSTLSINAIIELAVQHEFPAIALTDKNNLHGAIEFAQAAAKAGIKPIIGAELDWQGHRLCLYVQNQAGYRNLCRLLSPKSDRPVENRKSRSASQRTALSSDFGRWTLDFGLCEGLIAVSPSPALAEFFPERFYLEINSPETLEKLSQHPTTPSLHHSIPAIASFPIHYAQPSDRWKYDIVQSIRTLTLLRQKHPEKRLEGDYHFRPPAEMEKVFAAHPELLAHSRELAERCAFEFPLGKPQFPDYRPPDGSSPAAFLRRLVMEGLQRRYPDNHAKLRPQLEQELAIITDVGYEEYFLVVWDILQECRRRGIEWITRGSAADSLACYCLEISGVCPIRFDLYFRRFLNKDRMALNKLPDIDVDFPHDRKDDVIDLIFEKFGAAHTAVVGGFSTFQSRSAFAEVAKVLGVSEFQVRRITERLPHFSRASELAEATGSLECHDLPQLEEEPYRSALQMAHFLDGFPRYAKMHPCGVVLSRQPMDEITPCFISAKGYPTTHFDMDSVEAVGLVKMDILAQGGLAVIRDVQQMLSVSSPSSVVSSKATTDHEPLTTDNSVSRFTFHVSRTSPLDLRTLEPWTDPEVWHLIATGQARAVHHIESPAMISLCKMCNVQDIDTLIAIVSVIRPGAANESKKMEFARRYQGLSSIHYPHPSLELCLRSTFGLVVYEEHILQICEAFAGLPPGRADVLRRALAKDKAGVIAEIKTEFIECARERGHDEAKIAEVWELVTGFKGYAFCKAHSTAYGVEAYQSAWLKRYYPAEFMAAVLTNGKGFYAPLVYVLECHRLGISLLPPSVNQPGPQFAVEAGGGAIAECGLRNEEKSVVSGQWSVVSGNQPAIHPTVQGSTVSGSEFDVRSSMFDVSHSSSIRVPVLNVKGLTTRTKQAILDERARSRFSSLQDFLARVQPLNEEMEALIQSGAFDEFGKSRTAQYWQLKGMRIADCGLRNSGNTDSTQPWLIAPALLDRLPSVPLTEPERLQCLCWEQELLGYPVSGHPLELHPDIAWNTYCPIKRLGEHIGDTIVTCGLVIEQRLFHQITGEPMKFLTIADWTGMVETELFARTYKSYGLNTIRYPVLEITAKVEPFENNRGFTLRVLRAAKPRTVSFATLI